MRRNAMVVLALACAAGAILALANVQTPARPVLTLLFLLVVPGLAVAGLLRDRDPLATLTVAAAASLAVNILLAEAMLLFGVWSPRAGVVTIGVVGFFLFVLRLLYRGRTPIERGPSNGDRSPSSIMR